MTATQQPSTKQDILHHLLKQGQATAQALADSLNVSPQAIRRHLKDLEEEELLLHQVVQSGVGRPQHVYQLSREGRSRLPDSHDEFAVSLLDTLAETMGYDQVSSILRRQWERKAVEYREHLGTGSLQERVEKLVELRKAEGYMAEWRCVASQDTSTGTAPQFMITEYNCAISQIAESFPSVCGHELELFTTALQDCNVERTHWIINGETRCGYLVRSVEQAPKPSLAT